MRLAPALIVSADDYGYGPSYDRGILEAAAGKAVDAVSVMVARSGPGPGPLLTTGVEIGLHLELPIELVGDSRAGPWAREAALDALGDQLARFEAAFGRPASFLDGHHHCHAHPGLAAAIAREARSRGMPLRSVSPRHRRLLRCEGVATADRLVGRLSEEGEALPAELRPAIEGRGELPPGVTEWMVHPGHADPASGSSYDRGRTEDLDLLLRLRLQPALAAARCTHAAALL
jgi:predicted glycoside hydrolase/deacetylase ChbG (UPF0249 family)